MHGAPPTLLLVALALSGAGLLAGPLILSLGRGRATAGAIVEGLALGLVPTMVLLRLVPHVAESLGALAVALFAGAFLVLRAFDRAHHRAAAKMGRAFIYSALLLHSFTDGVGLAAAIAAGTPGHTAVDVTLTAAFVIHRVPEGLFIATTLLPSYGWRRTLERTFGLFAATVAGGLLGGALLPLLSERLFDAVVAIGLGAMLQLVLHSHAERRTEPSTRALTSASLLLGVVLALLVPAPDDLLARARAAELPLTRSLVPLFLHAAPPLLLAIVLAATLHALVRMRSPVGGDARNGLLFALLAPLGPAQTVPAASGLVLHGASRAAVVAFLLAATALGLDGAFVMLGLVGPTLTALQLGGALVLVLLGALSTRGEHAPWGVELHTRDVLRSWATLALRTVDQRGPHLVAGLLVGAGLEAYVDPTWMTRLPALAPLLLLPLLAAWFGATPLFLAPSAAVLLHKGLDAGAVLAMLLAAPIGGGGRRALVKSHRHALTLGASLVSAALGWTLASGFAISPPPLHGWSASPPTLVEVVAGLVVGASLVVSLLRLGPSLWLGQLAQVPEAEHHHEHAHPGEDPLDASPPAAATSRDVTT